MLEARQRINLEFRKKISEEQITEKLKVAKEVGTILKHQVVQAVKNPETTNYGKNNLQELIRKKYPRNLARNILKK